MAAWDRFYTPLTQWMDATGVPMAFAELYFFESGSTTIPLATYADSDFISPNAHPVVADATGTFGPIFLQELPYNVVFVESGGDVDDPVWSTDPVEPFVDSSVTTSYFEPPVFIEGKPTAAEVYPIWNITRALSLPADLTSSIFTIETLPTSALLVTIYKNAAPIGTISFATDGTPTVVFLSTVAFNAGDQFSLLFPAMQDATGANIAFSFVFTIT